jgi:hypothetical protein
LVDVANFLPSPHSLKNISTESHWKKYTELMRLDFKT